MIRLEVPESIDKAVVAILDERAIPRREPTPLEVTAGLGHDEYRDYGAAGYFALHLIDEAGSVAREALVDALKTIGALARARSLTARVTLEDGIELRLEDVAPERLRALLGEPPPQRPSAPREARHPDTPS